MYITSIFLTNGSFDCHYSTITVKHCMIVGSFSELMTEGCMSMTKSGLACVYCVYLFRFIELN